MEQLEAVRLQAEENDMSWAVWAVWAMKANMNVYGTRTGRWFDDDEKEGRIMNALGVPFQNPEPPTAVDETVIVGALATLRQKYWPTTEEVAANERASFEDFNLFAEGTLVHALTDAFLG